MQRYRSINDVDHASARIFAVWESTTILLVPKEFNLQRNKADDV